MDNITDVIFHLISGEEVKIGDKIAFKYKKKEKYGDAFIDMNEVLTLSNICRLMDMGVLKKEYNKISSVISHIDKTNCRPIINDCYKGYRFNDHDCFVVYDSLCRHFGQPQVSPHCEVYHTEKNPKEDDFTAINKNCFIDTPYSVNKLCDIVAKNLNCNDILHVFYCILKQEMSLNTLLDNMIESIAGYKDKKFKYRVNEFDKKDINTIFVVIYDFTDNNKVYVKSIKDKNEINEYISEETPFFRIAVDAIECHNVIDDVIKNFNHYKDAKNKECKGKHITRD